ncbi:MAG: hypothetical protein GC129_06055 [Proteobacteria bacterium]|nr:hypothetical protein [Pseudomonadota bacterium]
MNVSGVTPLAIDQLLSVHPFTDERQDEPEGKLFHYTAKATLKARDGVAQKLLALWQSKLQREDALNRIADELIDGGAESEKTYFGVIYRNDHAAMPEQHYDRLVPPGLEDMGPGACDNDYVENQRPLEVAVLSCLTEEGRNKLAAHLGTLPWVEEVGLVDIFYEEDEGPAVEEQPSVQ